MRRNWMIAASSAVVVLLLYLSLVHYTDVHQVGIMRNRISGELQLDDRAGFTVSAPWVAVARVDVRPMRVCVTSTARSYNCKLVTFIPTEYRAFVQTQGFRYYWLANRLSFNSGYADEYRGMKDILRGYAFGADASHPFIRVTTEY